MPDKKSPDADEETSSGGSKKLMVPILAVVLLAAGYLMGGKMGAGSASASDEGEAAAEAEDEHSEPHVGIIVNLDAVNINLADSRYLRVAISLGLHEDVSLDDGHGKTAEFPTAAASDVLLRTFTGQTIDALSTEAGREQAREELLAGLEPHYGHDVVAVYFTEFVMQ